MEAKKQKTPATAVTVGAAGGGGVGVLIEIFANAVGHPLPPGAGSAITSVIGMLAGYFAPGGRRGDPR